MIFFKNIQFREGWKGSLSEFKKDFAPVLKGLRTEEVKQAHKAVTKGNGNTSTISGESKKADKNEDKK